MSCVASLTCCASSEQTGHEDVVQPPSRVHYAASSELPEPGKIEEPKAEAKVEDVTLDPVDVGEQPLEQQVDDPQASTLAEPPATEFEKKRNSFAGDAPTVFKHIQKGKAGALRWNDLCYSVKTPNGKKDILKSVSGRLSPGKLTAILGPSGSGKTTLLNCLSGRVRPGGKSSAEISGQVTVNGMEIKTWNHAHIFGYVMQQDSLFATETPREIMSFSAKLRLSGVSSAETTALIEDMLQSLGLEGCADTMAGSELIKGISGGQKKRTSIAAELITNPSVIFLDEPTSGLDTAAAYKTVCVLKQLAQAQQSVMATIHQPSSEIFELFDECLFIAKGEMIFQGPPAGIRDHFFKFGHVCPEDYNPADFVMFLLEMATEDGFKTMAGASPAVERQVSAEATGELPLRSPGKGFCTELMLLSARQWRNTYRDKGTLAGRFCASLFMNLLFGCIFFQAGVKEGREDAYEVQTHLGAVTMVGINAMFGAVQPAILTFPAERPVFLREFASNMYGVVPYFMSKTVIELFLVVTQVTLTMLEVYWLMGMHGPFQIYVLSLSLVGLSSSSIALFFCSSISDIKTAIEVTPLAFVPQILFAGFFIKMDQIPEYFRWLQYICGLKWGMNLVYMGELGDDGVDFWTQAEKDRVLENNSVDKDLFWVYVGVLVAIICMFRAFAMVKLRGAASRVYA